VACGVGISRETNYRKKIIFSIAALDMYEMDNRRETNLSSEKPGIAQFFCARILYFARNERTKGSNHQSALFVNYDPG
jgi:hypothetical protein